jgi:5-oxoprolinase (ATP-hydrolysing)
LEHTFESITAGVTIQSPQLEIDTVAAGTRSIDNVSNDQLINELQAAAASYHIATDFS